MRPNRNVIFGLILGMALSALPVAGQNPDHPEMSPTQATSLLASLHPEDPDSLFPPGTYTFYHASKWTPFHPDPLPKFWEGTGYVGPTVTGYSRYYVQLDLPNGSMLDSITAVVYDVDSSGWITLHLLGYEFTVDGSDPAGYILATSSTSGTPGYTSIFFLLNPPLVIREFADINGDGTYHIAAYLLELYLDQKDGNETLRFAGAAVHWHRIISPAPATATFPDVPTDHWAFQYVEALAASGITQGYSDGTFRPTSPVTRAQMATFLARALGLYWEE